MLAARGPRIELNASLGRARQITSVLSRPACNVSCVNMPSGIRADGPIQALFESFPLDRATPPHAPFAALFSAGEPELVD